MGAYLRGWLHWLTQRLKLIFSWILSSIRRTISKYLHWDRTTRNYNLLDFSWLWYLCKTLCTCALIDCFMISGEHQFSWTGLKFRVSTIILLCKIVLLIIQFYVLVHFPFFRGKNQFFLKFLLGDELISYAIIKSLENTLITAYHYNA